MEEGPDRYAVIQREQVQIVSPGDVTVLDIPDVRTGVAIGDEFLLALNTSSGIWIWPPRPGIEMDAPGGQDQVGLLIGQTATETSPWFYDAAVIEGSPSILYLEVESETDPIQTRMMLYDLDHGETTRLFDKFTRRDGLSGEESDATIGDAALGSDRLAVLFAFGDSTWIEWYDLNGSPIDGPSSLETIEGSVLELAIADDTMVLGVEPDLHRLITHLWVADLQTGQLSGPIVHETDRQSLRSLAFDGRWLTATVFGPEEDLVGSFFADVRNQAATTTAIPAAIIPVRD